jgi:hypothetical protein
MATRYTESQEGLGETQSNRGRKTRKPTNIRMRSGFDGVTKGSTCTHHKNVRKFSITLLSQNDHLAAKAAQRFLFLRR